MIGMFISVPILMFLSYLTGYHIWLRIVGKSTYEHILEIRKRELEKEKEN